MGTSSAIYIDIDNIDNFLGKKPPRSVAAIGAISEGYIDLRPFSSCHTWTWFTQIGFSIPLLKNCTLWFFCTISHSKLTSENGIKLIAFHIIFLSKSWFGIKTSKSIIQEQLPLLWKKHQIVSNLLSKNQSVITITISFA